MGRACPGMIVAGLRGGSGKTILSMGLLGLWRGMGRAVVPFKKGPDYIDAAWLAMAAGRPCYNLDPYLMTEEQLLASYARRSEGVDGVLVEGNRGLYDGVDEHGTYSTAELAKLLGLPVVIVLDATKTTRTAAAMVLGLRSLDPDVPIAAVILNRVAGARHESVSRRSIERYGGVRVVGAVPRLEDLPLPERHLGLVPPAESDAVSEVLERAAEVVSRHVDVEALWGVAKGAAVVPHVQIYRTRKPCPRTKARLGVMRDQAFHFYYPENLEALSEVGLDLVEISALQDRSLPAIDGLYIGGGFPEIFAQALADNLQLRGEIRSAAANGLPVYAECGGLMYLGEGIRASGKLFPMVGALPLWSEFTDRPQGHGYTELETCAANPFFEVGTVFKGHEFHYSKVASLDESKVSLVFNVRRGRGLDGRKDGVARWNVLATYSHIHASSCEQWAWSVRERVVRRSSEGKQQLAMAH